VPRNPKCFLRLRNLDVCYVYSRAYDNIYIIIIIINKEVSLQTAFLTIIKKVQHLKTFWINVIYNNEVPS